MAVIAVDIFYIEAVGAGLFDHSARDIDCVVYAVVQDLYLKLVARIIDLAGFFDYALRHEALVIHR